MRIVRSSIRADKKEAALGAKAEAKLEDIGEMKSENPKMEPE